MSKVHTEVKHCVECDGIGWKEYVYIIDNQKIREEGVCWKCGGHGEYPSHLDESEE